MAKTTKKAAPKKETKKVGRPRKDINQTAHEVVDKATGVHEGMALERWVNSMGVSGYGITSLLGGAPQVVYKQYKNARLTNPFRERLTRAGYGVIDGEIKLLPLSIDEVLKQENEALKKENSDLKTRLIAIQEEFLAFYKLAERK